MFIPSFGGSDNLTPWSIDQQTIQGGLYPRQLRRHLLTEFTPFSQFLRLDALYDSLALGYQHVQLFVRSDIQRPKAFKKLMQVSDGGITKDFGPTISLTTQTIR
jgi:hypothetical protein